MKLKQVGEKNILYVMAAKPEYGAHLQERFSPLFTGIGPVEAAISLTHTLQTLPQKPDLIVNLGSAGSNSLNQAQIYQVSSVSYRDMDASPLGFEKGATPLLDLPVKLTMPHKVEGIEAASLSTGANVISGEGYNQIDADMVDMETFALVRVCMVHNVELIGLRGISDGKEELQRLEDWMKLLPLIDERLATAVDQLEKAVLENTNAPARHRSCSATR